MSPSPASEELGSHVGSLLRFLGSGAGVGFSGNFFPGTCDLRPKASPTSALPGPSARHHHRLPGAQAQGHLCTAAPSPAATTTACHPCLPNPKRPLRSDSTVQGTTANRGVAGGAGVENMEAQVPSCARRKGARPRMQPHHATQCRSENTVQLLTSKPAASYGSHLPFSLKSSVAALQSS